MLEMTAERLAYLSLLGEKYPSEEELTGEIIRLNAMLNLPKGTEHFMSDIHGEYEAFCHIMNNCSGVIREKVNLFLGDRLTRKEVDELCTLIYYPREKLKMLADDGAVNDDWYRSRIDMLVHLARMMSSKYTRTQVRAAMPHGYEDILDELLHAQEDEEGHRHLYHLTIVDTMVEIRKGGAIIQVLASLIKHLAVARLHVVGDIFDRGPRADSIMDILMNHPSIDIEWGNHDALWMGAASGSLCCIAAVVRNSLAYNNTEVLENGYGIPLRPLVAFGEKTYPGVPALSAALEAITILMFKLEGQLIRRNPEFGMEDRLLLHRLPAEGDTMELEGRMVLLKPHRLPTVNAEDPYALTAEETQVMEGLRDAFLQSLRLREHIGFLYRRGWLYRCYNGNLLFHGCIPLTAEGDFLEKTLGGKPRSGKSFMDYCDAMARRAFHDGTPEALDFMWYLWCGGDSPLCGRQIKTFARYFVADEECWKEPRNPYYIYSNQEEACQRMLEAFGLTSAESHIINGHTPVRVTHGESALKAGGKLIVIDGGFCKAYQKTTGIAGYTLIANSHGMRLMSHNPFTTKEDALTSGRDIHSQAFEFLRYDHRRRVRATDRGEDMVRRVEALKELLEATRAGLVKLNQPC